MMCLACEQDALWFAYLQRRGLITSDGFLVEQPPFLADAFESAPAQEEKKEGSPIETADKNKFSCDEPTAE
jgi:hypothetical protein